MKISFYYLKGYPVLDALIMLLDGMVCKKRLKVHLICAPGDEETLDNALWSKRQLSFIPHMIADAEPSDISQDIAATPLLISSKHDKIQGFKPDILLSLVPKIEGDLKALQKYSSKIAYLVNPDKLPSFQATFDDYQQQSVDAELHILEAKKWRTEKSFNV